MSDQPPRPAAPAPDAMPPLPGWMRQQAEEAAAAYAAGVMPDVPQDDPARLAARIAELRDAADSDAAAGDDDGWFATGADAAHTAYLDALGNVDDRGADSWADYRTYTPDQAAAALVERGVPPDDASGMVERYRDSLTWDRGWSPQDQWEIDDDDLDIMLSPAVGDAEMVGAGQADAAARDPERDASITAASWAIAARDAAYDRGDITSADRFSAEAGEAIASAQRAGVDLGELAYELDYPGGVDAMLDGGSDASEARQEPAWAGLTDRALDEMHESVQDARAAGGFWQPAAAREQWRQRDEPGEDGRRWELRDVTGEPADVADAYGSTYGTGYDWTAREFDRTADRGLTGAGEPVPAGPVLTAEAAAHAIAENGSDLDEARANVARYVSDVSEALGERADMWGLDDADLDALRESAPPSTHAVEQDRRDQLNRWHDEDDHADATATAEDADEGPAMGDPISSEESQS